MEHISGVVFSVDECEQLGRQLARDGCTQEDLKASLADRPYALRRILHFYEKEKIDA